MSYGLVAQAESSAESEDELEYELEQHISYGSVLVMAAH